MRYWRFAFLAGLVFAAGLTAKKKEVVEKTQILALPVDPPMVAVGETGRLVFHVSPLTARGLLSQQTREALKAILKLNGGVPVIHVRIFVAGSGDLRRAPQIVSEVFREKKLPLPSVSVVQVGALPMAGAQVVVEAVSVGKKEVNPDGLSFMEARPLDGFRGGTPLLVTCFAGSVDNAAAIAARFPGAAVDVVQPQREMAGKETLCEAVSRGGSVKAARLAFTGARVAFGTDEKAAALAFERIDKDLSDEGVKADDVVSINLYPLSVRIGELARKVRPFRGAVIPFEGVASIDGSFAIDAVAIAK
jgi:enamine deaminase RidA (YjgF/YER057c/UK114 family)